MKKVLIVGASSKNSIGYHVGEYLRSRGYEPVYASRSGKLGMKCDLESPAEIKKLLAMGKPGVVIHAAGVFNAPQAVGAISEWSKVFAHLYAKSSGALMLADAVVASKSCRVFIALGGREISDECGFVAYTIGNGALFGLIQFMAAHTPIQSFFVDMPFIRSSTMEKAYQKATDQGPRGRSVNDVCRTVENILDGKNKNSARVVIGKKRDE